MNTAKHTATPWRAKEGSFISIVDADGKMVCRVPWGEMDWRHTVIISCVNSHAALVEALRACVALLADDVSDEQNAALYAAEKALAEAGEA